jgi:2-polyprenyl-3-methyl-5-hydroxy-6-metoxy-1,4-benzoquinol methylase
MVVILPEAWLAGEMWFYALRSGSYRAGRMQRRPTWLEPFATKRVTQMLSPRRRQPSPLSSPVAADRVLAAILDRANPLIHAPGFWYYVRYLQTARDRTRFLRALRDDLATAGFAAHRERVLDAACGFGLKSICMRLLGAHEVHAIDIRAERVAALGTLLERLPQITNVHAIAGDATRTGYPDGWFDLIYCYEALSHMVDVPGFLQEAWRLLKPGGVLFISDANNGSNPAHVRQAQQLWDRLENGPPGTVAGHTVGEPFRLERARLLRELLPDAGAQDIVELAEGTFGYSAARLAEVAAAYRASGTLPRSRFRSGHAPVSPTRGYYVEQLLVPGELAGALRAAGFRARVYADLGGAGGNPAVRAASRVVRLLSPFTWPVGRSLKVVARKPRTGGRQQARQPRGPQQPQQHAGSSGPHHGR